MNNQLVETQGILFFIYKQNKNVYINQCGVSVHIVHNKKNKNS